MVDQQGILIEYMELKLLIFSILPSECFAVVTKVVTKVVIKAVIKVVAKATKTDI